MSRTVTGNETLFNASVDLPDNGEPLDANEITDDIEAVMNRTSYLKHGLEQQHYPDTGIHKVMSIDPGAVVDTKVFQTIFYGVETSYMTATGSWALDETLSARSVYARNKLVASASEDLLSTASRVTIENSPTDPLDSFQIVVKGRTNGAAVEETVFSIDIEGNLKAKSYGFIPDRDETIVFSPSSFGITTEGTYTIDPISFLGLGTSATAVMADPGPRLETGDLITKVELYCLYTGTAHNGDLFLKLMRCQDAGSTYVLATGTPAQLNMATGGAVEAIVSDDVVCSIPILNTDAFQLRLNGDWTSLKLIKAVITVRKGGAL